MSLGVRHLSFRFTGAILLLCGLLSQSAQAGEPASGGTSGSPLSGNSSTGSGDRLDFSPSGISSVTKPNFPDRPQSMERMFDTGETESMPMPLRFVPTRRSQQWIDEQNNWAFLTPEDVVHDFMKKEIMRIPEYGPDGQEKSSGSAVERFYERISRSSNPTNVQSRYELFGGLKSDGNPNSRNVGNPLASYETRSSSSIPGFDDPASRPNTLSDFFGSRKNSSDSEAAREREAQHDQMEAFRKALDFQQPSTPIVSFNPLTTPAVPGASSSPYSFANTTPVRNPYDPMTALNPVVAPTAPVAPSWQGGPLGPGQQNASTELPTLSGMRPPPPKADFSLPNRKF
jgi:hypothetical protein